MKNFPVLAFYASFRTLVAVSCMSAAVVLQGDDKAPIDNKKVEKQSETALDKKAAIFPEEILSFKRTQEQAERVFDTGYVIFSTPYVKLKSATKYIFNLNGKSEDNGIVLVIVNVSGQSDGKGFKKDIQMAYSNMSSGYANGMLETPATDSGELSARIYFYRAKQQGVLKLISFSLEAKE